MTYQVKTFVGEDLPIELAQFRYKIYVEEMNRPQMDACHESKTIKDILDYAAHNVVVYEGVNIIGCVRINFLRDGSVGLYEKLFDVRRLNDTDRRAVSICTRLMVDSAHRYKKVPLLIMKYIYTYKLNHGIRYCYMDCNDHLLSFFQRFGCTHVMNAKHPDYGDVNVLKLDLLDIDHLVSINSPFVRLYRKLLESEKKFTRRDAGIGTPIILGAV